MIRKVVIDTNIYISAIFWGGKPRSIIDLGRDKKIQIFTSQEIEEEIAETLIEKFKLPKIEVEKILLDLSTFSIPVIAAKRLEVIQDDPDDNKFLECAMQCKADYIVSGDKHLVNLKEYAGIKILRASEFLTSI